MSDQRPSPSAEETANQDHRAMDEDVPAANSASPPALEESSKKKSRLQWDEENLQSNAAEMERAGPRMKIDEPKTPFVGSETGSSTSGSAHQSPPESPSFIPGERLVGFHTLEQGMRRGGGNTPSETASSAGSAGRSVHISDDLVVSGGSSPRSREEFAARRRAHYRNEARVRMEEWRRKVYEEDEDDEADGVEKEASRENEEGGHDNHANATSGANGVAEGNTNSHARDSMMNGHKEGGPTGPDEG